MNLKVITNSPYTFLPSGILIVEPHRGLLAARTMLLAAADYYSGLANLPGTDHPRWRRAGYEVAIAILSESLGDEHLSATAHAVRERWPGARVLIFGRTRPAIEDNLYDARIDHRARPEDLLAALGVLSEDTESQRGGDVRVLEQTIMRLAAGRRTQIAESDPTKRLEGISAGTYQRDLPAGERQLTEPS